MSSHVIEFGGIELDSPFVEAHDWNDMDSQAATGTQSVTRSTSPFSFGPVSSPGSASSLPLAQDCSSPTSLGSLGPGKPSNLRLDRLEEADFQDLFCIPSYSARSFDSQPGSAPITSDAVSPEVARASTPPIVISAPRDNLPHPRNKASPSHDRTISTTLPDRLHQRGPSSYDDEGYWRPRSRESRVSIYMPMKPSNNTSDASILSIQYLPEEEKQEGLPAVHEDEELVLDPSFRSGFCVSGSLEMPIGSPIQHSSSFGSNGTNGSDDSAISLGKEQKKELKKAAKREKEEAKALKKREKSASKLAKELSTLEGKWKSQSPSASSSTYHQQLPESPPGDHASSSQATSSFSSALSATIQIRPNPRRAEELEAVRSTTWISPTSPSNSTQFVYSMHRENRYSRPPSMSDGPPVVREDEPQAPRSWRAVSPSVPSGASRFSSSLGSLPGLETSTSNSLDDTET